MERGDFQPSFVVVVVGTLSVDDLKSHLMLGSSPKADLTKWYSRLTSCTRATGKGHPGRYVKMILGRWNRSCSLSSHSAQHVDLRPQDISRRRNLWSEGNHDAVAASTRCTLYQEDVQEMERRSAGSKAPIMMPEPEVSPGGYNLMNRRVSKRVSSLGGFRIGFQPDIEHPNIADNTEASFARGRYVTYILFCLFGYT